MTHIPPTCTYMYLCVCTTNLDNISELCTLLCEGSQQYVESRQQATVKFPGNRHVHGSGERVVGTLAAVHVVIWVDWIFGAQFTTQHFNSPAYSHGEEVSAHTVVQQNNHTR